MLQTAIEYLKGVGPAKAELLKKELNIFRYSDLLQLFPFRYIDRSKFYKISEINSVSTEVQIIGKITKLQEIGSGRGSRLSANFSDGTGNVELVWFKGVKWLKDKLKLNTDYVLFGKPTLFNSKINFAHPELDTLSDYKSSPLKGLQAVYPSTDKLNTRGINSRAIAKLTKILIPQLDGLISEYFSDEFLRKNQIVKRDFAYSRIHFPSSLEDIELARRRLKFDEFFFLHLEMLRQKALHHKTYKGYPIEKVGHIFNEFYNNHLPFELTNAQKRVLKEIRFDMRHGEHMNRLVQGDVGSGKTIVAVLCMLMVLDSGFQACLMAPTEILATQHYYGIAELLEPLGVKVKLLTGSSKTADRREIHAGLLDGSLSILIGTHALIEEKVAFKNLGLAVVDEQHRFGVAQRAKLWKKNTLPPHVLVMTATPIPRTLAMSLYGNLDSSIIDELPPGRKPITTVHKKDESRLELFGFLKEQIKLGRQVYIVYPLIDESETMDYKDLMDGYESVTRAFPPEEYQLSIVHGRMKAADKDYEMQRFVEGKTQIMEATTVIEVGVNVPNASVMVIESAERFGLSQLHQLRGRVGRGAEQSFCILMTSHKLSSDARTRIKTMTGTNDGFEIAEVDMKLRGPGDILGTRQSGLLNFQIADLTKDSAILEESRNAAIELLKDDPRLSKPENSGVLNAFQAKTKGKIQWGRIS